MQTLDQLFSIVCKPNPKSFPDESEAAIIFTNNKFIFVVHFAVIFLHLVMGPFEDLASSKFFFRLLVKVTLFVIFLVFCRSHPFIGQTITALLVNAASFKVAHLNPEGMYLGLFASFGLPWFVFYYTQNLPLTVITSIVQILPLIVSFKTRLTEALSFSDPEIFAETFSQNFISLFIPMQILHLIVVYRLNIKTTALVRAQRKTEEALEQQKIFLYSFSHEMRNPMNSLLGNLDLALMSQVITPEIKEMIGTAKVCGVLLLNLINTVLDAGKLGLGKLEVNPVATRLHDIFQRVWAISHDLIGKKGLKSHLKISREVPSRLFLDSHRLNQVLMNLIGNATKFTETGSIQLSVNWLPVEDISDESFLPIPYDDENEGVFEKDYNMYAIRRCKKSETRTSEDQSLILSGGVKEFSLERVSQPMIESKGILKIIIKDTGCGMGPEDLAKLFQKFSQVGQVTTKRQMGTGLGLFISKEIIENMGGQIRAYSKPKVGSTFVICIPTTALPIKPHSEQQISIHDHLIPKLKLKRFKTIVADDSSFNVNLVCNFYSKIGVEVLATASNGKMAYDKYLEMVSGENKTHIDIITLDIDMPLMNGKEVCEKIRVYERENKLKRSIIVLISGNYEEEDMHTLLAKENLNRPDCFLKKPLVFEEFCWALYKHECLSNEF